FTGKAPALPSILTVMSCARFKLIEATLKNLFMIPFVPGLRFDSMKTRHFKWKGITKRNLTDKRTINETMGLADRNALLCDTRRFDRARDSAGLCAESKHGGSRAGVFDLAVLGRARRDVRQPACAVVRARACGEPTPGFPPFAVANHPGGRIDDGRPGRRGSVFH